jgi:hypothetical protein
LAPFADEVRNGKENITRESNREAKGETVATEEPTCHIAWGDPGSKRKHGVNDDTPERMRSIYSAERTGDVHMQPEESTSECRAANQDDGVGA